jgi:hypothetical protein
MDLGLVDGIIGILLAAYFAVRSSAASLRTTARRVRTELPTVRLKWVEPSPLGAGEVTLPNYLIPAF